MKKIVGLLFLLIIGSAFIFAEEPPVKSGGWHWDEGINLNGKVFFDVAESYREQDGWAEVKGFGKLHYWLYDTYAHWNGDGGILYQCLFSWIESMGYSIDYAHIGEYIPNNGLAPAVKKLMTEQSKCDVSVTFVNSSNPYLVINHFYLDENYYWTIVYPLRIAVSAQNYNAMQVEKGMILPDGAMADVAFFKKWSDAGKYLKASAPTENMDVMISTKVVTAKTESELGSFSKWYEENENESVKKISEIMKETGAVYGIAWIYFSKQIRRGLFTYKDKKVRYVFLDFFDKDHELYVAWKRGEDIKRQKRENFAKELGKAAFGWMAPSGKELSHEEYQRRMNALRSMPRARGHIISSGWMQTPVDLGTGFED